MGGVVFLVFGGRSIAGKRIPGISLSVIWYFKPATLKCTDLWAFAECCKFYPLCDTAGGELNEARAVFVCHNLPMKLSDRIIVSGPPGQGEFSSLTCLCRIPIQAAIEVWNEPLQCCRQEYDSSFAIGGGGTPLR
jgi:hypothetical protein